ncbi:MAG: 3-isopropylmalate dehydrogenase [Candidatus Margulisbacteria bacterium]|nr:3-isopropylmalate dehydrogenase [Candidatus Margulisiibacteriota bacterium]
MYKIALINGDGTGPEVVSEAVKVLKTLDQKYKLNFQFTVLDYTATRHLRTGEILSDEELEGMKQFDAILLGAIGDPRVKPGVLEKGILLKIRFGLDQYINLRPVKLYENVETPIKNKRPKDIDYVVVRENSGGLYTGSGGVSMKGTEHEVAVQNMIYTWHQVERCVRYAFEYTRTRKAKGYPGKLTLCGKSNVLTYVFDIWERAMKTVGQEFPDITTDYVHVDAMCIYMIECPERFDVIVTENLFGDIITDLAAVTQGGLGISPGANINPKGVSMFEPIGGTAPDFTGKNEINPMACIGAAHLMLAYLGEEKVAQNLENAMKDVIKEMHSMAAGKMGFSTTEIGDKVVRAIG